MPIINKPWIEPPFVLPAGTTDMEEAKYPNPIERYKFEPDGIMEKDLIYAQIQNRLFLALKMAGEQVAFYRQKQSGDICSCVDKNRQSAVSTCRVCHGTRFVGGYDYLGKALVQFPQAAKTKLITELGIKVQETMMPWTLNFPLLKERDFLVRKMNLPLSGQLRIVDEPVIRGNYGATEDILARINLMAIWKVSNTANAAQEDYVEGTDYILAGGEMVLEESGNTPVANYRTLRLLGKKARIFKDTGVQTLQVNAGVHAGLNIKVRNDLAWTGDMDYTLNNGTGADAGYFVFTINKTGIENRTAYPLSSFIAILIADRIAWLTGGSKPANGATYYVTYDYVQTFTQRYQVKGVSPVSPQGAVQLQSFELDLLDPTTPIYSVGSIFDNGEMIEFHNSITKEMERQLFGQFGLAPGNQNDKKFNQETGYY